jgi:hypothetical protein
LVWTPSFPGIGRVTRHYRTDEAIAVEECARRLSRGLADDEAALHGSRCGSGTSGHECV